MVPLEYIRLHYVPQYKAPVKYYTKLSFIRGSELLAAVMGDICCSQDGLLVTYEHFLEDEEREWNIIAICRYYAW